MKYLQSIKEKTQIGLQYVKEFAGTKSAHASKEFDDAEIKYKYLREKFTVFKDNVLELNKVLVTLGKSGTNLGDSYLSLDQNLDCSNTNFSSSCALFFKKAQEMTNDNTVKPIEDQVIKQIVELEKQLNDLEALNKERNQTRLLADAQLSNIRTLESDGKYQDLAKYQMEYNQTAGKLSQETSKYINEVRDLYQRRHVLFESTLQSFIGIMYNYIISINYEMVQMNL